MIKPRIRVLVYEQDGWWIIRGLDYHFMTLTERLEDVPGEIRRFIMVMFAASWENGVEPFNGYSRAPRKYWEMYERAEPWTEPVSPIELPKNLGSAPLVDTRLAA